MSLGLKKGPLEIFYFLWLDQKENDHWLNLCIPCNKNGIKGLWVHKGRPSLGPEPALVLQWTLPWPYNTPNMALYILAIFLHFMQQKCDQGTLGTQRSTLIGSRTRLGPSMDPAMALYIRAIFLHSMQQKSDQGTLGIQRSIIFWSRTSLGPSMDPAMAFNTPNMALYILAIVLHSMQQKWDQGTLETQRSPLIGSRTPLGPSMDPAIALQYT